MGVRERREKAGKGRLRKTERQTARENTERNEWRNAKTEEKGKKKKGEGGESAKNEREIRKSQSRDTETY